MSTHNQRAANHRAEPNSAAPGSQPISRYNPAQHGIVANHQIMFDEAAEDLAGLAAEYHQQYSPTNAKERFLVDTLIHNEWRLRRMRRVEAELWDLSVNIFLEENAEAPACSSGEAFNRGSSTFERLQKIVNLCERNYHRALKELQRVQPAHYVPSSQPEGEPVTEPQASPAEPPQPQQSTTTSALLASFRQNPQSPDPAATEPSPAAPFAGLDPAHPHTQHTIGADELEWTLPAVLRGPRPIDNRPQDEHPAHKIGW
jgi:hypothetical protein